MVRSERQNDLWHKVTRVLFVAALAVGGAAGCGDDDSVPAETEDDGGY